MHTLSLPLEFDEVPLGWLAAAPGSSHGWSVGAVAVQMRGAACGNGLVPALTLHARLQHNWNASRIREAVLALEEERPLPPLQGLLWDHRDDGAREGLPPRMGGWPGDLVRGWERFRSVCLNRLADDESSALRSFAAAAPWAFLLPEVNASCRRVLGLPFGLSPDDVAMLAAANLTLLRGRPREAPDVDLASSFLHFCETFLLEDAELATPGTSVSRAQLLALMRHYFPVVDAYRVREKNRRHLDNAEKAFAWSLVLPFVGEGWGPTSAAVSLARLKSWAHQPALVKRLYVICRGNRERFLPYRNALRDFRPLDPAWSAPARPSDGR